MASRTLLPATEDERPHKKWTVAESRRLVELGILDGQKYELLEGEIMYKGDYIVPPHRSLPPVNGWERYRHKWTVAECRLLTEHGLLEPGKYELLEGEIYVKMGQGQRHIITVTQILAILGAIFGYTSLITQAEIGIGENEDASDPQPDVAVVEGEVREYADRRPDPATEIRLVVEAAVSSLQYDTTEKAAIYSRNGLREYWVVAVAQRELLVYRQPSETGYQDIQTFGENDSVSPLAAPESVVHVADLLP